MQITLLVTNEQFSWKWILIEFETEFTVNMRVNLRLVFDRN